MEIGRYRLPAAVLLMLVSILVMDFCTPLGYAVWFLYLIPAILTAQFLPHGHAYTVMAVISVFSLLGFLYSPSGGSIHMVLTNRAIGIMVLWVVTLLVLHRRKVVERLQKSSKELLSNYEKIAAQAELRDLTHDAIIVRDLGGKIFFWNRGAEVHYGYDQTEALSSTTDQLLGTSFPKPLQEILSDVERQGAWEGELLQRTKGGEQIVVASRWTGKKDERGVLARILEINTDITMQKMAERQLQKAYNDMERLAAERSGQLKSVLEAVVDPIILFDMGGNIVLVNDAAVKAGGFSSAEKMKVNIYALAEIYEIGFPDGGNLACDEWPATRIMRGEAIKDLELVVRRRDSGEHWYFSFGGQPVRNRQGRQTLSLMVIRDITDRRCSEDALRNSEERLRIAVETTGLGTFDLNPQTGGLIWSDLAKVHLGIPADGSDDLESFLSGIDPADREQVRAVIQRALRGENGGNYNTSFRAVGRQDSRRRRISSHGRAFFDRDGKPVRLIGVTLDETELKEVEERIIEERSNLERAYEELKTFSYSVAHDLRTPLRGISNFSQLLIRKYGYSIPADGLHYLGRINENVSRMGFLIDGLLNLAFISRYDLKPARVDLAGQAESIIDELRRSSPGRTAKVHIDREMIAVGDPYLLRVLLENLLGNAWKYTKQKAVAELYFTAKLIGSTNVFCVQDNGVGFDMTYADKLFQPFQRLHDETLSGMGVGLAAVKRIVERHGGEVWAEGKPGEGATFCFTLTKSRGDGHEEQDPSGRR